MTDSQDFSERELRLMSLAWLCFDEQPKVDYEKLASLAGMSHTGSASNAWGRIKKKLAAKAAQTAAAAAGGNEESSPAVPKPAPRRRGKKAENEDEESPAKKAKGRKGKATAANKPSPENDDEEMPEGSEDEKVGIVKKEKTYESDEEDYEV